MSSYIQIFLKEEIRVDILTDLLERYGKLYRLSFDSTAPWGKRQWILGGSLGPSL